MSEKTHPPRAGRRSYRRPVLAVFGSVHDRTLSNASNNMNDKGNGSFSMT
jgi:hypothetical protein